MKRPLIKQMGTDEKIGLIFRPQNRAGAEIPHEGKGSVCVCV